MQVYDLLMLIVLSMATIFGAIKGFAWQVASLASILVSYIVAYRFRFDVAEMIQAKPPWNQFLAMLILYVGTSFVIWVGFRLVSGMIDKVRLKEFDRHLGAAFGLAKGLIFCLLITMFAMSLLGPNQQTAICHSKSGYYIATALDRGVGILPKELHDVIGPYLTNLDTKLKNGQSGDFADSGANIADASSGAWDALQNLPKNLPGNLPSLPDGIADAIPDFSWPNGNSLNPPNSGSSIFPPANPPQNFPPLTTGAGQFDSQQFNPAFNPNSTPSNGLRPSSSGGNQAQQPGLLPLPR